MTFALHRYGTLIERHSTRLACAIAAIERGLAYKCSVDCRTPNEVSLRDGVEIVDEDDQIDLEDCIACAKSGNGT